MRARPSFSRRELIGASAVGVALASSATVADAPTTAETVTVAQYVISRLRQHGAGVLFGVPGATCDPLFAAASAAGMPIVTTASDLEAGYAADGYARVAGLAAVSVTYGVGTLSLAAAIAGALAERSPVVIVNGGPSGEDLRIQNKHGSYFSHSVGRDESDISVFRELTAFADRAAHADDVPRVVDTAIRTALVEKKPVYIEIAKHIWGTRRESPGGKLDTRTKPTGNEAQLAAEILDRLRAARRPVVLLGIELHRRGLSAMATALVARLGLPWSTTLLAKSVIDESTAGFVGVYGGERAPPSVKVAIEGADTILALGCVMSRQYRKLVTASSTSLLRVADGSVKLGAAEPLPASFIGVVEALLQPDWLAPSGPIPGALQGLSFGQRRAGLAAGASPQEIGLGYDEIMEEVSGMLDESVLVVPDTTLAMYPAADLQVRGANGFICNATWQAIGYSVAASVGIALGQSRRPVVLCGDGGFRMTATALSTMARLALGVIVLVFDNGAYAIEQWLLEPSYFSGPASGKPRPYLALDRWDYPALARSMGVPFARAVANRDELRSALAGALESRGPALISVAVRPHDLPAGLR